MRGIGFFERKQSYMVEKAIIIGGSAGSLPVILRMVEECPASFEPPFVIVVHRGRHQHNILPDLLARRSKRPVVEAEHYDQIQNGKVLLAPTDYHLLVGTDHHLELDLSEKVLFSRPSIDVSFISFAHVFKEQLVAVVLSGANADGAAGAREVLHSGGAVIVQDPAEAEVQMMPRETLNANPEITHVVRSSQILQTVLTLINR